MFRGLRSLHKGSTRLQKRRSSKSTRQAASCHNVQVKQGAFGVPKLEEGLGP